MHCSPPVSKRFWTAMFASAAIVSLLDGCNSATTHGVSMVAAQPVSPADGVRISFYSQPLALVVANPVSSATVPLTLRFEIATRTDFANTIEARNVTPGPDNRTSITVAHLEPSKTYFWRVKTMRGAETTSESTIFMLSIGPAVVIDPPELIAPASASIQPRRPTFVIRDAERSGPAGEITYLFEIASEPSFASVLSSQVVSEASGTTVFTPSFDLPSGGTFYWRVRASETTIGVASEYSSTRSFRTAFEISDGPFSLEIVPASGCSDRIGDLFGSRYVFDGRLQVLGDRLKWTASHPDVAFTQPMTLDVTRSSEHLDGGIDGEETRDVTGYYHVRFSGPVATQRASVSGDLTANDTATGTLKGWLFERADHYGSVQGCVGAHTWTLSKR